jgi:hypothetical protein
LTAFESVSSTQGSGLISLTVEMRGQGPTPAHPQFCSFRRNHQTTEGGVCVSRPAAALRISLLSISSPYFAAHAHGRINTSSAIDARGRGPAQMGIIGWLLVWLIVNALFVVWLVRVVSPQLKTTDQSVREAAGTL